MEEGAAGLGCTARSCSAASGSELEVEQGMGQQSLFVGENFENFEKNERVFLVYDPKWVFG